MTRLKIGKAGIIIVMLSIVFSLISFTPAQAANGNLVTWRTAYSLPDYLTQTITSQDSGLSIGSGTDRILVVGISAILNANSTMNDPSVVTYGNVPLTKATGNGGTSGHMHTWLYYLLDNPTVMNGTYKRLKISISSPNGTLLADMDAFYAVYSGISQSGVYTTGNGFSNVNGSGPAKLSSAMSIPSGAQAIYMSSVYMTDTVTMPSYTLNTNWASGSNRFFAQYHCFNSDTRCSWENQAAYRTVPTTDTTDDAATSVLTPSGHANYAMSAMVLPQDSVATTTGIDCNPSSVNVYSAATCTATVTRASGSNTPTGTVNFSSSGSGSFDHNSCTLAGSNGTASCSVNYTPSHVGTGTHTLTAAYAGDTNFSASSNTAAETVNPLTLTVTATGTDKTYDGTPATTVTLADNRVAGDDITVAYTSAAFVDKNVAQNKEVDVTGITVTGPQSDNYTWNTTAQTTANLTARTLNVTATGVDKVYDATTAAAVTLNDDRLIGDDLTVTYTDAAFSTSAIGSAIPVTVNGIAITGGADAGNYTVGSTTADTTASITGYLTHLIVIFNHISW